MWMKCNPNPAHKEVSDCVIRAIALATNRRWVDIYDDLCRLGRKEFNVPIADAVWGKYLYKNGFKPFLLPDSCPECVTIRKFSQIYPEGTFIIGTGSHAVAVINGDYYDSWDSGNEIPSFFFWKVE